MKNILLALTGLALLSACKKDTENQPAAVSNTELLTAKNWRVTAKVTSLTTNGQTATSDDYATSQPCERDNFYKFNPSYALVIDEGATKCAPTDPQTNNGTWGFASNEKQLVLSTQLSPTVAYSLTFDILELSATTMRLRYTDTSNPSYTAVQEATFTAF